MPAMESLLDSNSSFDEGKVRLLDTAIQTLYSSNSKTSNAAFQEAQSVLTRLQQHPESWRLVQIILQHSELENTRLFALSLLTTAVRTRWNVLPDQEKSQIPKYLYELSTTVVKSGGGSRTLLTKINETLAEVIKRVWPETWTTFIEDLIQSASSDKALVFNNLSILSLFVEDVLDFGEEEIISRRAQHLKQCLLQKFPVILHYTLSVIQMGAEAELELRVKALTCSYHCLKHTPINYALDLDFPKILLSTSFQQYETRVLCIQNLTEIFTQGKELAQNKQTADALTLSVPHLQRLLLGWHELMQQCSQLSDQTLRLAVPGNHRQFWETFYVNLALCCTAFHKYFFPWLVESEYATVDQRMLIRSSVDVMRRVINVPDDDCFSVCVDFWQMFSKRLDQMLTPFIFDGNFVENGTCQKERFLYDEYRTVFHDVRRSIIEHMARPPEVYVSYDEETGCAIGCKFQQRGGGEDESEELSLYTSLKDTLVHLTRIDPGDTESICLDILKTYTDSLQKSRGTTALNDSSWNVHLLCKLCWSIGSISGILPKELPFLLIVLKSLLNFCQVKSGKESKALIASMIMYVMGQYPKYLKQNEQLLKVVVDKCFEFMDETFPGVQDMACETYFKVAQGCAEKLAVVTTDNPQHTLAAGGGTLPYIIYLCHQLPAKASKFTNTKLTLLIYSATSLAIAAHPNPDQQRQLLRLMIQPLDDSWKQLVPQLQSYADPNQIPLDTVRNLAQVIGINNCAASAMANVFAMEQLGCMVTDMLKVYELFGEHIDALMKQNRLSFAITKEMRSYRKAVLRLLNSVIENCDYSNTANAQLIRELIELKIIPYVVERVLSLYSKQQPDIREHEVMLLGSSIIKKWTTGAQSTAGASYDQVVNLLLHHVFVPSLEMIKENYTSYPEIRKEFFHFTKTLIQKSFQQILGHLPTFVLSLVFGIQHQNPEFGILALKGLQAFLLQIANDPNLLQSFMSSCYFDLLSEVFNVLTDTSHQYGFNQQAAIIHKLMGFAHQNDQVAKWLNEFLIKAFPHLGKNKAQAFALRFITTNDEAETKRIAKDLNITLKEYSLDD